MRSARSVPAAVAAAFLAQACLACGSTQPAPPELVGHWEGDGRIIVTWCEQERLELSLDIEPGGGVTGAVGDATLSGARLRRNRGALGRALNVKTDWIIVGELEGPIVAAEHIRRDGVKVPFMLHGDELRGAVHTTGWHVGGADKMVLTAAGVTLRNQVQRRIPAGGAAGSRAPAGVRR